MVFDKFFFVQLFLDNDAVKTQRERGVRPRTNLQPQVGFVRDESPARINADHLDAFLEGVPE